MATKPQVFIVESLYWKNEKDDKFEGKILSDMLHLGGKKPRYYYVRTKRELREVMRLFEKSEYRYLHLSCHGNSESIDTTLDEIEFQELGEILNPYLKNRRLFMSSCDVVNEQFAEAVMPSGCRSVSGPNEEVDFDQAATLWASFYYLAFSVEERQIKNKVVRDKLRQLAKLFGIQLTHFQRVKSSSDYRPYYFP